MKTKAVLAWSGGKDSALALSRIRAEGQYEITALITTIIEGRERSGMHDVRRELVEQQARALGLPWREVRLPFHPTNQEYENRMEGVLRDYQQQGVTSVVFGDLFLEDIKRYRDQTLAQLGLKPVYPLWGLDTRQLAHEFIASGFKAILVCVDAKVLDRSFAGRWFDEALLQAFPTHVDPCGENGEFHTFVCDGPGFNQPVPVRPGAVSDRDGFYFCDLLEVDFPTASPKQKICPQCGTRFTCGPADGKAHCWCFDLPHVIPLTPKSGGCLCPACLKQIIAETIA